MVANRKSENTSPRRVKQGSTEKRVTANHSSKKMRTADSNPQDTEDQFLYSLCYGDNEQEETQKSQESNVWLLFFYLLISPKIGWRRIKKSNISADNYAKKLFYPLLALVAACRFVDKIYFLDVSIGTLLQKAVNLFIAGFGGYFLVSLLGATFLPVAARVKMSTNFGKVFIMTVMSCLAVSTIIAELMPWLGLLLLVAPIYSAYILVKGIRYIRIPESETTPVAVFLVFFCLGVPLAIYYMFDLIMPTA